MSWSLSYPEDTTGLSVYKLDWPVKAGWYWRNLLRNTLLESPVLFHDTWIPTWLLTQLKTLTLVSWISLGLLVLPCVNSYLLTCCQDYMPIWCLTPGFPNQLCCGWTPSLSVIFYSIPFVNAKTFFFFNRKHFIPKILMKSSKPQAETSTKINK